jgi:cytochrome c553
MEARSMQWNRFACAAALAAGLCVAAGAARAADPERGRSLAYTCLGCHGVENSRNAYPNYAVPKLAGQNAAYVVAALEQYDSGNRWHPTMQGFAKTLTDEDRADLAAWFSSLSKKQPGSRLVGTPPPKAELCVACHGQNGEGTLDEYPNIGGQHADYIEQALADYRRGRRKNPVMAPFAQQLSDDEVEALAKYFSKQPGLTTPSID